MSSFKKIVKNRFTIWSPKDGQPCADHDRASGEGVVPQEYTLIKLQLLKMPASLAHLEGKQVFLVPGTLRPETMYGQTNCWVHPDIEYGAFEMRNSEIFICTKRSAYNMSFQDLTNESGKIAQVGNVKGSDLIGMPVRAPLSKYPVVYCLPMTTILESKGNLVYIGSHVLFSCTTVI